jgi:hypothetical protein
MYDGGFEGGIDAGHQEYDLNALHAEQGSDSDSFTNYDQFAQTHAEESDVEFSNFHNVEASDGNGAFYSETDATEFSSHEASFDNVTSEEFTNAEHNSEFSQIDQLRERFEADFLSTGPEVGGHEGGYGELSAK